MTVSDVIELIREQGSLVTLVINGHTEIRMIDRAISEFGHLKVKRIYPKIFNPINCAKVNEFEVVTIIEVISDED